jgi:hypothetical protein
MLGLSLNSILNMFISIFWPFKEKEERCKFVRQSVGALYVRNACNVSNAIIIISSLHKGLDNLIGLCLADSAYSHDIIQNGD